MRNFSFYFGTVFVLSLTLLKTGESTEKFDELNSIRDSLFRFTDFDDESKSSLSKVNTDIRLQTFNKMISQSLQKPSIGEVFKMYEDRMDEMPSEIPIKGEFDIDIEKTGERDAIYEKKEEKMATKDVVFLTATHDADLKNRFEFEVNFGLRFNENTLMSHRVETNETNETNQTITTVRTVRRTVHQLSRLHSEFDLFTVKLIRDGLFADSVKLTHDFTKPRNAQYKLIVNHQNTLNDKKTIIDENCAYDVEDFVIKLGVFFEEQYKQIINVHLRLIAFKKNYFALEERIKKWERQTKAYDEYTQKLNELETSFANAKKTRDMKAAMTAYKNVYDYKQHHSVPTPMEKPVIQKCAHEAFRHNKEANFIVHFLNK